MLRVISRSEIRLWLTLAAAFCLLHGFSSSPANAQDTVILKSEKSGKSSKRRGEIESWRGNTLTIRSNSGSREIDGDRIVRIETAWPDEYLAGLIAMNSKDFPTAIKSFQEALLNEQRKWARTIIRSELVKAYLATDKYRQAVQEFAQIVAADPETRFKHLIPLAWTSTVQQLETKNLTANWLDAREPLLQLIAASWHMSGETRRDAIRILEKLSNDFEKEIASLARVQLWRTTLAQASPDSIQQWQN